MVPILLVHSVLGALLLQGRLGLAFFSLAPRQPRGHPVQQPYPTSALPVRLSPPISFSRRRSSSSSFFWILTAWLSQHPRPAEECGSRKPRNERPVSIGSAQSGALAAGLSHEFATPLNTAQLRLARVARAHNLEADPDLLTAIEELDRCGDILRHMAGSQLQPDRLSLEVVDLEPLVRQVSESIAGVHEGATIRVLGDGRGVKRVLIPPVGSLKPSSIWSTTRSSPVGRESEVEIVGPAQRLPSRTPGPRSRLRLARSRLGRHLGEPFVTTKESGSASTMFHSLAEAIGAELTLDDREFGGAVAKISIPIVPSTSSSETPKPVTIPAPI